MRSRKTLPAARGGRGREEAEIKLQERGFKSGSIQLDVTTAADRQTIYDGLQRTDERLDFLVNNIGATAETKDYPLQTIERTAQRRLLQALHQQRSYVNSRQTTASASRKTAALSGIEFRRDDLLPSRALIQIAQ